jgi:hypothetical protein
MHASRNRKILFNTIIVTTLVTDVMPLLGMWLLGWSVLSVMFLYWFDCLIFFGFLVFGLFFISQKSRTLRFSKILFFLFFYFFSNLIQTYLIFVYNGQFYIHEESIMYRDENLTFIEFITEIQHYIRLFPFRILEDHPEALVAIVLILANHMFELFNPYHNTTLGGWMDFVKRLSLPTFAILIIASVNFVALLLENLEIKALHWAALGTASLFLIIKLYYDIKRIFLKAAEYGEI